MKLPHTPDSCPLENTEDFFSAIIESTDDAVIGKTLDGTIMSWNPAAERIFGYTATEIIGKPITLLFPAERLREEEEIIALVKRGEKIDHFETVRIRKDGQSVRVRLTITPIRGPANTVIGITKIAHDVTKWEESQAKLKLLEACVSKLNDVLIITEAEPVDEPGPRILFVNEAFYRSHGYTEEETIGRSPRFMQGEKTDPQVLAEIKQALKQKEPITRELINYDKQGQERWVELNIVPIREPDGKCHFFAAIQRDITERKRDNEKIIQQATLLDKTHDAITLRDLDGRILYWNKGAEGVYGWSSNEVLGKQIRELLFKQRDSYDEACLATLNSGKWVGELQMTHKDGKELVVQSHWSLIKDDAGQAKAVLGISFDISDRKRIEAQFMRAQRMESIGTLAGGIAHDLNNILSPIMMSIDMLRTLVDNAEAEKILTSIELSAKRGADIVRQVLSFARGMDGQRIEVQAKHLLKDLERIISDTFPKDIHWQFDVPNNTWVILADPTQIQQILLNLCVNARDAMPRGGLLSLTVQNQTIDRQYAAANLDARPGPYVVISVTDTGFGIPREILNKIFEPFFTTKEQGKGTGLGLSTVAAIVKSHQGFFTVYSELGKGSNFKIYLPAEMSAASKNDHVEEDTLPRGNGETVLIVEDEASILEMTSQTLQAFGYRVLQAQHGAQAVAVYAQHRNTIHVVMTDMMMPVMDGAATINALMSIDPEVKIIAVSGLGSYGSLATVSGTGVKHFLTKPHTAGALLQTLKKILHVEKRLREPSDLPSNPLFFL